MAQARQIAEQFDDAGIVRVISSPSLRCRQTVGPLAERIDVAVEIHDSLAEHAPLAAGLALVSQLAGDGENAALCSHGDVIPALLTALESDGVTGDGHVASAKAGAFILDTRDGRVTHARYIPPPDVGAVKG